MYSTRVSPLSKHPCYMDLAIDATTTAGVDLGQGLREVDIKKYMKVEKVPGGQLEDSKVLKGVKFNTDAVAPGKMRRSLTPEFFSLTAHLSTRKEKTKQMLSW